MRIEEQIKLKCVKFTKLCEELDSQFYNERMKQQLFFCKKMIALQLRDLVVHTEKLLENIEQSNENWLFTEEQQVLKQLKLMHVVCRK